MRSRSIALTFLFVLGLLAPATPSAGAELRIDFRELAALASGILSGAKIRLHTASGGMLDFAAGSSVTIGGTERPIPTPVRSFEAAGARYAYLLNDINSTGIKVSNAPGAVRLMVSFEEDGPELTGRCLSGICPPDQALPEIEWRGAAVSIDFVPARVGTGLSLKVQKVELKGSLDPGCLPSAGFFAGSLCRAILPQARHSIARFRKDLDSALLQQINASTVQEKIANALKGYLAIGPAGEVHISKIAIDPNGHAVVVSFCLTC